MVLGEKRGRRTRCRGRGSVNISGGLVCFLDSAQARQMSRDEGFRGMKF